MAKLEGQLKVTEGAASVVLDIGGVHCPTKRSEIPAYVAQQVDAALKKSWIDLEGGPAGMEKALAKIADLEGRLAEALKRGKGGDDAKQDAKKA